LILLSIGLYWICSSFVNSTERKFWN